MDGRAADGEVTVSIGPQELLIIVVLLAVLVAPVVLVVAIVVGASRRGRGQPAPASTAAPGAWGAPGPTDGSVAEQLRELAALRDQGILSEAEFEEQKARVLR